MAKPYREVSVRDHVFATSLDTLWRWIRDREGQVRFDDRLESLVVIDGEWGVAGCVTEVVFFTDDGARVTSATTLIDVQPGSFFVTRVRTRDVVTDTVHSTSEVPGGVLYRHEMRIETKPVGLYARGVLASTRAARHRRSDSAHTSDMAVIQRYLDTLDGREV